MQGHGSWLGAPPAAGPVEEIGREVPPSGSRTAPAARPGRDENGVTPAAVCPKAYTYSTAGGRNALQ